MLVITLLSQDVRPDISNRPFALRLTAAFDHLSSYADGRGYANASTASPYSTSINPASEFWLPVENSTCCAFSFEHLQVHADKGSHFALDIASIQMDIGSLGRQSFVIAKYYSNEVSIGSDLDITFDGYLVQLPISTRLNKSTMVGARFYLNNGKQDLESKSVRVSTNDSNSLGFDLGVLHELQEKWLIGAMLSYSRSRQHEQFNDRLFSINLFPDIKQRSETYSIRLGTSVEFKTGILLVDYQWFKTRLASDSLTLHRVYAGYSQTLFDGLYASVGAIHDNQENTTISGGLGFIHENTWGLDLTVQKNIFPEIKQEIGEATLFNVAFWFSW